MNIMEQLETKRKELVECVINNERMSSTVIKKSKELDTIINNFYQYGNRKEEKGEKDIDNIRS